MTEEQIRRFCGLHRALEAFLHRAHAHVYTEGLTRGSWTYPLLMNVAQGSGLIVVLLARSILEASRGPSVHSALGHRQHLLMCLRLSAAHLVARLILHWHQRA